MKIILARIGLVVSWLMLTYELGIQTVRFLDSHLLEVPQPIEMTVRCLLQLFGQSDVNEPETIGALCGLLILLLCWFFIAALLAAIYKLVRRFAFHAH